MPKHAALPDLSFETEAGFPALPVAGVDEAGRGPLAGPVVAAAVILDAARLPDGLNDSKKLTGKKRAALFEEITAFAHVGVGILSVEEIDRLNIHHAALEAMRRAVAALPVAPAHALIDGKFAPSLSCPATPLIGGDGRALSIAAASVVAKVTRDKMMCDLDRQFPDYGWAANKGYGTAAHKSALERVGASVHHRRSFAPIRKILSPDS